jgi:hypothetical protein
VVETAVEPARAKTNLLKGISHNVSNSSTRLSLANSVDPTKGLLFNHGVPVRLHKVGSRRSGKIKTV